MDITVTCLLCIVTLIGCAACGFVIAAMSLPANDDD